jgi:hypothetical protein
MHIFGRGKRGYYLDRISQESDAQVIGFPAKRCYDVGSQECWTLQRRLQTLSAG